MGEKKYQVFISSTRVDLEAERRAVIGDLLRGQYIPVAMEAFPSFPDQAWILIKSLLEKCDCYVLILGGKYGSIHPEGKSYTEMEYDYAVSKEMKIFPFFYKPVLDLFNGTKSIEDFEKEFGKDFVESKFETDSNKLDLLRNFYNKVDNLQTRTVWENEDQLARRVATSLDDYLRDNDLIGWIRGDEIPDNFKTAQSDLVEPCNKLGISFISLDGIAPKETMQKNLSEAKEIRFISTSGVRFFEINKPQLVNAVANGCKIKVLVPHPESEFVKDVEKSEAKYSDRIGIADEISIVINRLTDIVGEANSRQIDENKIGSAFVGFFTTHLRSAITICENQEKKWGWFTVILPPLRAAETVSFELENSGNEPLIDSCIKHFERTWEIAEERNQVKEIKI
jgi:hypothetical protein